MTEDDWRDVFQIGCLCALENKNDLEKTANELRKELTAFLRQKGIVRTNERHKGGDDYFRKIVTYRERIYK